MASISQICIPTAGGTFQEAQGGRAQNIQGKAPTTALNSV